jgi:hypothetical protein
MGHCRILYRYRPPALTANKRGDGCAPCITLTPVKIPPNRRLALMGSLRQRCWYAIEFIAELSTMVWVCARVLFYGSVGEDEVDAGAKDHTGFDFTHDSTSEKHKDHLSNL